MAARSLPKGREGRAEGASRESGDRFYCLTMRCVPGGNESCVHSHFCSLIQLLAASGGIEGVVYDPSGRAVRGARVACGGAETITAIDGRFQFPGAAGCRAEIGADGFETQAVEMRAGAPVRVTLAIAGVVERVVVSATRHETTAEQAGVAATVVTGGELERREFPMIHEALRMVPGLSVVQTGRQGGLTSVFTRGAQRTGTLCCWTARL